MALPDYFKIEPGTAVVWGHPAGSGVTNNLSLDALANSAGRMGVASDLGAQFEEEFAVFFWIESGTAPAAGVTYEAYIAASHDNSNWPGTVTGSDAAYTIANRFQLGGPAVVLYCTAVTNTLMQAQPTIWRPPARYVAPVVVNLSGQAIRNQGTPANNLSRVILVPRRSLIQDNA